MSEGGGQGLGSRRSLVSEGRTRKRRETDDEDVSWLQTQRPSLEQQGGCESARRARSLPESSAKEPGTRAGKIRIRRRSRLSSSTSSTEVSGSNDSLTRTDSADLLSAQQPEAIQGAAFLSSLNSPPRGKTPTKVLRLLSPSPLRHPLPLSQLPEGPGRPGPLVGGSHTTPYSRSNLDVHEGSKSYCPAPPDSECPNDRGAVSASSEQCL